MFNPETANVQDNGATIIDRRRVGDTWIWLCDNGGVQPYVTWVSGHNSPDATEWGHYFGRFTKAYEDFCARISNQWKYENGAGY